MFYPFPCPILLQLSIKLEPNLACLNIGFSSVRLELYEHTFLTLMNAVSALKEDNWDRKLWKKNEQ